MNTLLYVCTWVFGTLAAVGWTFIAVCALNAYRREHGHFDVARQGALPVVGWNIPVKYLVAIP